MFILSREADLEERKDVGPRVDFIDMFPTPTAGDGKIRPNNARTGAAQGQGSFVRKALCKLCGFPLDLTTNDHSGGSLDGEGAAGTITTSVATYTYPNGTVATEDYGTQSYNQGAGCPLCFSKNSSKEKVREVEEKVGPMPFEGL